MKLWFLLIAVLFTVGCNSKADTLIPESYTAGAVFNIKTIIKQLDIGDRRLKVTGVVPFDIERERVFPSLLAVLKKTIKEHPSSEYIFLSLGPDMETALLGYSVGVVTLENNKIKLKCNLPSAQEMTKHNSRIGKMELSGGLFGDDPKHPALYDGPRLFVPDQTTFQNARRIALMVYDKAILKYDIEDRYKIISRQTGLPAKEVKNRFLFFEKYYGTAYPGSGEEFKPNP